MGFHKTFMLVESARLKKPGTVMRKIEHLKIDQNYYGKDQNSLTYVSNGPVQLMEARGGGSREVYGE